MFHERRGFETTNPLDAMPWAGAKARRSRRGRTAHHSGLAAEDCAARIYAERGAPVVARRCRTPHGEIDLIVQDGPCLVFVEVKARKRPIAFDSPVSPKQWERLKNSALHYMIDARSETGVHTYCRFDVALVAPSGAVTIIENARSFDED